MPQKLLTLLFLMLGMFNYSQVVINEVDADNPGSKPLALSPHIYVLQFPDD